jgi:hypothetical protein
VAEIVDQGQRARLVGGGAFGEAGHVGTGALAKAHQPTHDQIVSLVGRAVGVWVRGGASAAPGRLGLAVAVQEARGPLAAGEAGDAAAAAGAVAGILGNPLTDTVRVVPDDPVTGAVILRVKDPAAETSRSGRRT